MVSEAVALAEIDKPRVASVKAAMAKDSDNLKTPDGRYIVVRGRLWRASNPSLDEHTRQQLVDELMDARRMIRDSKHDLESSPDLNEFRNTFVQRTDV